MRCAEAEKFCHLAPCEVVGLIVSKKEKSFLFDGRVLILDVLCKYSIALALQCGIKINSDRVSEKAAHFLKRNASRL